MGNARDIFAPLFRDLMHLEITLIYHPFTDRTAAPDPAAQLEDIQKCYEAGMPQLAKEKAKEMNVGKFGGIDPDSLESTGDPPASESERSGDLRANFDWLAETADVGVSEVESRRNGPQGQFESMDGGETTTADLDDQELTMLRIRENSRQILRILDEVNYQPVPTSTAESLAPAQAGPAGQAAQMKFKPEHVMQIRKYWEVRPQDEVFMRTVIGMDGDVIAHIDPRVREAEFSYLQRLHEQSVKTSVDFWKELVGILADFVSTAVNAAFFR